VTAPPESQLFLMRCRDGRVASFGPRQMRWLEARDLARQVEPGGPLWFGEFDTPEAANALVLAQPELRECDFCRHAPAGWRIPVRRFVLTLGPAAGPIGGDERPMFACDICVEYVRSNRKQELVEYAIASTVEYARTQGGALAAHAESLPWHVVKAALTPMVREVVYGMFANRSGWPERDTVRGEAA
jgi:hypothetical protein